MEPGTTVQSVFVFVSEAFNDDVVCVEPMQLSFEDDHLGVKKCNALLTAWGECGLDEHGGPSGDALVHDELLCIGSDVDGDDTVAQVKS